MDRASPGEPASNLLDRLDAWLAEHDGADALLALVPFRPAPHDVELRVRDHGWAAAPAGRATLARLAQTVDPVAIEPLGGRPAAALADGRLHARFADERLAALGAALERGGEDPLATRRLAPAQPWVVNFGDPNATKALHVGHLRNLAIGNALASAAEALGGHVVRQSRVGDYGRSMGEAMAGYLAHGGAARPGPHGPKGDHLIGDCYLRYVLELPARAAATADPEHDGDAALSRERVVHHDAAEQLLERWRDGDPDARRLLDMVRRWVLDGHEATYARLGVRFDRTLLESDHLDHGEALVREALAAGAIERGERGATMYATGEEGYPHLLLHRRDGFPTQHLRYVATYDATRPLLAGSRSITVFGSEWRGLIRSCEALLRRLRPGQEIHPTDNVMHGMVVGEHGDAVKSSRGGALLVDQLLDELAATAQVAGLARRHAHLDADAVSRMVLLGFFLGRPLGERVSVTTETLLDARRNAGWALAQAWAHAGDERFDGAPDPEPGDPHYRFLLVQSQRHRRLLAKGVQELDLLPLVRFHYHLARWYASVPATPRLARAMRAALGSGLVALGLAARAAERAAADAPQGRRLPCRS